MKDLTATPVAAALLVALLLSPAVHAQVVSTSPAGGTTFIVEPDAAATTVATPAAPAATTPARPAAAATRKSPDSLAGYDFEHVVQTLETSVDPLSKELDKSFKTFIESVSRAEQMLDEGKTGEAVDTCAVAINEVLSARERVLKPMWDGQQYLQEQIGVVRERLAKALEASQGTAQVKSNKQVDATLDGIAKRIAAESDPIRKKRLVAHYYTIRNLAQIRQMAMQMSPDQRKLWTNVLKILEEAGLAHQQVLMSCEVLFAQFEATAGYMTEYQSLLQTVDGASRLLGVVRGVDGKATGMTAFAESMKQLQGRLAGFNESLNGALQSSMFELEGQVDALQPMDLNQAGNGTSPSIDAELEARLKELNTATVN